MKKIVSIFSLLLACFMLAITGCVAESSTSENGGGGENPQPNPQPSQKNAAEYFWGKWTRMDNGEIYYVSENSILYEETDYKITGGTLTTLKSSLGTITKESANVAKLGDIPLFRSSAVNVPYTFTLIGFKNNGTVAQTLGAGYEVTASCSKFPSYKETVFSDRNGRVTLHSPISKVENLVTVTALDGTKVTATLTPNFADEDLGSFSVSENGKYALKVTGKVEGIDYLYTQTYYDVTLTIENISDVVASNSVVELSSNDEHLQMNSTMFNIASIAKGMYKTVSVRVQYKDEFKAPYVDASLALKFTDARTENSWTDYVPLRFYGKKNINVKAYNTEDNAQASLNGFIMYPDGNGQQFTVGHNASKNLYIPLFPSPYKVVFGGAVIGETLSESTEMKYSLGVETEADYVGGTFSVTEMNFAERNGGNDTENTAYDVENSEKIKAYLHAGDIDYYSLSIYSASIPYTVKHLFEQQNGTYVCNEAETQILYGFIDGSTNARPKSFEGYVAQTIEQKIIDNYTDTVVEVKYDAVLTGIEVTQLPVKTEYYLGDISFDTTGMVVTGVYGWGTKTVTGWTTDGDEVIKTAGESRVVTVNYTEGGIIKTATFTVNVTAVALSSISITTKPAKLSYYTTDSFDTTGMVVKAIYNNGATKTVTDWTCDGDEVIKTAGTSRTVTVSYTEGEIIKTATFTVNVALLSSISITTKPAKLSYYSSDTFDTTGMVVTATYDNGTTKTVTGWTTDGDEVVKTAGSSRTVTVTYTEGGITKTATFTVNVKAVVVYSFHETVEKLSSVTIYSTSYDIVTFGDWPQTIKPNDVTVNKSDSITRGANTYYKGNDGYWYAEVSAKPYGTGSQYRFTDGTSISSGSIYYFKVEPIKWRVLARDYNGSGKALLLAEKELSANIPYYNYNSSSNTRTVGSDTNIYSNNYKYSQVRAYLNGLDYYYDTSSTTTTKKTDYTDKGFFQTAFTETAQSHIAETTVDNSAASTTDATGNLTQATKYACANTSDKVFLLSEKEATTTAYGFAECNSWGSTSTRIRMPTDYALANYAECNSYHEGCWWLRSPNYRNSYYARYVFLTGDAIDYNYVVSHSSTGIVPALTISW